MKNRVAASASGALAHINEAFGWNLAQWGNLTPDQVRQLAKDAKDSRIQRKLVETAWKYFQEFVSNQKEIERLTAEAIALGLKTKAEIDQYIWKTAIESAKHDAGIQKLAHTLGQELNLVQGKLASDKALATASFQQRLQLLVAAHQGKISVGNASFAQRLAEIQAAPARAIAQQQKMAGFMAYINARDHDPIPAYGEGGGASSSTSSSTGGGSTSGGRGGFLGGLMSFFTGRK